MANEELFLGGAVAAILGLALIFFILFFAVVIGFYIYCSLAFRAIARKARYSNPDMAWIPLVGPALIASKTAKMPWWPILLLLGVFIPVVGGVLSLAYYIIFTIWMWKTFKVIDKPEWWAILLWIPIVNLIMLGIAAWSTPRVKSRR